MLAFDVWLLATTGKKQFNIWTQARAWPRLAGAVGIGLALGFGWPFSCNTNGTTKPASKVSRSLIAFSSLQDGKWSVFLPTRSVAVQVLAVAANFFSGLAAPLLPFKAAEFLRSVKAEL